MGDAQPVPGRAVPVAALPETWAIGPVANPANGQTLVMVAIQGPYGQMVHFLDLDAARKVADDLVNATLAPGLIRAADLNGKPKPPH